MICSAEQNQLCNFGGRRHGKYLCEIILKLNHSIIHTILFKDFSMFNSGCYFLQWCRTICAILVERIMKYICIIIFKIEPVVQEMLFKDFLLLALAAICSSKVE